MTTEQRDKASLWYSLGLEVIDLRKELELADKEYRQAEADLRQARNNLGALVSVNTPERLFTLDLKQPTFVDVHYKDAKTFTVTVRYPE